MERLVEKELYSLGYSTEDILNALKYIRTPLFYPMKKLAARSTY
jgi:hypothetical protein